MKKSIATPQLEYELAMAFAKQLFQTSPYKHYESDLYTQFSKILSTDANKSLLPETISGRLWLSREEIPAAN